MRGGSKREQFSRDVRYFHFFKENRFPGLIFHGSLSAFFSGSDAIRGQKHVCSEARGSPAPLPLLHVVPSWFSLSDLTPPSKVTLGADLSGHELPYSWWKGEGGDDKGDDSRIEQAAGNETGLIT